MPKGIMDLPEGATDSDPRWQRGYADGETDHPPTSEDRVYVAGWCTGHCGAHQTTQAAAEAAYRLAATRTITVGERTIPLSGMDTAPRDGTVVWIVDRFGGVELMRVPPAPFSLTDEFVPMWVPDDPVEIGHGAWSNEHLIGWAPREALPDGPPAQGGPEQ